MNGIRIIAIIIILALGIPGPLGADTNSAEYWYKKGQSAQDIKTKIECFNRALQLDSRHSRAHNSIGIIYIRKGLYDQAISHLRMAVKLDKDFLDAYINLAIATRCKGDPGKSIDLYTQVLSIDPYSVVALYNQAIAFEKMKQYSKAIQNYLKVISMEPDNGKAMLNLGVAYFRAGDTSKSIQVLETVLAKYPGYGKAHFDLGMIYYSMNRNNEANYHFQQAANLNVHVPGKYRVTGSTPDSGYQKPEYTEWTAPTPIPHQDTRESRYTAPATAVPVAKAPTSIPSQMFEPTPVPVAASNYYYMEATPEVLEEPSDQEIQADVEPSTQTGEYEQPQSLDIPEDKKNSHEYWFHGAIQEQDPQKREYYLKRALRLQPDYVPALLELANQYLAATQEYEKQGMLDKVKETAQKSSDQYEKVIAINPTVATAYLNLGVLYAYYLNNPVKAVQYWEKFLELNPDSPRRKQIQSELKNLKNAVE